MSTPLELGLYTFGDRLANPETGRPIPPAQRMTELLEMARFADETGLDIFGVGERHGPRFLAASGATILAAMAAITQNIRLTSAVTLLSTADPLRVHQDFATIDLISNGRAEIMVGRGISMTNFELFGVDRAHYDAIFAEKLDLLDAIRHAERLTWSGAFRPALENAEIEPRPVQTPIPLWTAASSEASHARAARLGLPVALPLIARAENAIDAIATSGNRYRAAWHAAGRDKADLRLATFSFFFASRDESEIARYCRNFSAVMAPRQSGADDFAAMCSPNGGLAVGSPQQVIDKIMTIHERVGDTRHLANIDIGAMPHRAVMDAIATLATEIAPVIRRETAHQSPKAKP